MHGTAVDGQDDRDEMGICIEPPEYVCGLEAFEQYIFRTQPEGHRSGPGDVDLTIYSARKWMRLAVQGNPTVLLPLFVSDHDVIVRTELGDELRALAPSILSRRAGERFHGYLAAQRDRLLGVRGGKHTNRPELIEIYGFDTKYAMHMVRLGVQGVELLETGTHLAAGPGAVADLAARPAPGPSLAHRGARGRRGPRSSHRRAARHVAAASRPGHGGRQPLAGVGSSACVEHGRRLGTRDRACRSDVLRWPHVGAAERLSG